MRLSGIQRISWPINRKIVFILFLQGKRVLALADCALDGQDYGHTAPMPQIQPICRDTLNGIKIPDGAVANSQVIEVTAVGYETVTVPWNSLINPETGAIFEQFELVTITTVKEYTADQMGVRTSQLFMYAVQAFADLRIFFF